MKTVKQELQRNPMTMILLGITLLQFIVMQLLYWGEATQTLSVFEAGGSNGNVLTVYPQDIWRLVSAIFVHIGLEHFVLNAVTLYFVGAMAEQIWGSWCFLFLYLLSGVMGNAFVVFLTPDVVAAGASTALFGLFAAIALVGYVEQNSYLRQAGQTYIGLIVMNLLMNLFMPDVSMVSHIGGAVGGALCAFFLPIVRSHSRLSWKRRFLALGTYLLLLTILVGLTLVRTIF